ncbi:hypothetical protein A2159_01550, partial [Candidatus Woesebacteria bacterium RBG_13_34_9]
MSDLTYTDFRDTFFEELFKIAKKDSNVILLMSDQGAFSLERFKKEIPKQLINVGIAEQNMIGLAAGLALIGKKVFVHAIANFTTLRCYEQIKVDLSIMNLPVTIVGVGAGIAYTSDGPTHHANQDIAAMRAIPGIRILNACDIVSLSSFPHIAYNDPNLTYIRFDKGLFPSVYSKDHDFKKGLSIISEGRDVCIVSTGIMIHSVVELKRKLAQKYNINPAIIDIYRLKPLNYNLLSRKISHFKKIITIEEHISYGGLGTIVSDFI